MSFTLYYFNSYSSRRQASQASLPVHQFAEGGENGDEGDPDLADDSTEVTRVSQPDKSQSG